MTDQIKTERLLLRRFREDDIVAISATLQDRGIARMIPTMPWPYQESDAREFVTKTAPALRATYAAELDGALVGAVGINGQLGYWFMRSAWGRGFATEASQALLKIRFEKDQSPMRSGHRLENKRSRRVLTKLGFRDTVQRQAFCHAEAANVAMQDMELTFADWEAQP
ncbi:GNAT family N-acetyltransferase [Roseovarius aestuarii]|uniref:N-acetyltransferase domain-containing protein n=1 Tax=Roseovarius aestuarii TaxID=475083 RepID=A0A1X7BPS9_9RHOB|nr:GNAT family N-acetyltransferase [Roseovarius aestuarii]SMC11646.1 hypothetical protein ROA7745_01461 [Roseovarius aestuarii]